MVSAEASVLSRRWWQANSIAFVVAYLLYVPVAHGFTGAHPGPLSPRQLIAHTVGLVVVAGVIFGAQLWALGLQPGSHRGRLIWGSLSFVFVFWIGWYAFGGPVNVFMSFSVLATATWIGAPHLSSKLSIKAVLVALGMLVGLLAGLALFGGLVATGLAMSDTQASPISHTVFWLCAAAGTGIVGGFLSGLALPRALVGSVPERAS